MCIAVTETNYFFQYQSKVFNYYRKVKVEFLLVTFYLLLSGILFRDMVYLSQRCPGL